MRSIRTATLGLLTAAGLVVPAALAGAAPTRSGTVLDFRCGDAEVNVLLAPGGGNKSWSVDDANATDGTSYHLKVFEIRVYPGVLTSEPAGQDPAFVWSHGYGERTGQGDPVICEGHRPLGTSTGFITVTATVRQ